MVEVNRDNIAELDWSQLIEHATRLRHELHRFPEVSWQEQRTAGTIRDLLTAVDIDWRACAGTGTVARIGLRATGAPIALRADIDALPIEEQTGLPHASDHGGCMHACGHDGHTATLMAAVWWLKKQEAHLQMPISLLFQPAEEGGHGAREMIRDGALDGISRIYGWHNWPAIPYGKAVCPDGAVMAANGTFRITVTGQGGHASQPEQCRDPVLAAAAITVALQQLVSRRLPPQDATVVSVTSIIAPSADTVIPDRAVLGGSIRLARDSSRAEVERWIAAIAQGTAQAHGVQAQVECFPRYGVTANDPIAAQDYRNALQAEFGEGWHSADTPLPIMASEDFSYYLGEIPGAFALIGADDGAGHDLPCHSPQYDFNDALISHMARVYARLAGVPLPG